MFAINGNALRMISREILIERLSYKRLWSTTSSSYQEAMQSSEFHFRPLVFRILLLETRKR